MPKLGWKRRLKLIILNVFLAAILTVVFYLAMALAFTLVMVAVKFVSPGAAAVMDAFAGAHLGLVSFAPLVLYAIVLAFLMINHRSLDQGGFGS